MGDGAGADAAGVARRLTLLRHGRAAPPASDLDDHERPLVESGRRDVIAVLSLEAVRADLPTRVLSSTARRALETARCALETLGLDACRLETDERLYLAGPRTIRDIVAEQDALGVVHLMVVGHNPGLEALAGELDARSMASLPTAGLCRFVRRGASDASRHDGAARLLFETRPG